MQYVSGQTIGRHELVAPLGSGSMGEVWQALLRGPQGFGKPVALKLLHPTRSADPEAAEVVRSALIREARLGALLHHPNVVGIYELGAADGVWFVAMELVRGPSVAELLRARRSLPEAAVLEIGEQTIAGLRHVHALKLGDRPAGLVHRDIKPSNLLVDRTGLVKVADLGMASVHGAAAAAGGTPSYMAPEQAVGRHDARSDIWSVGMVLYELSTGVRPFGSGTEALGQARRVEERLSDPAFLEPVDRAVPGLGAVIGPCLRLDPDDRWSSMAELGAALGALDKGGGESLVELLAQTHPELDVQEAGLRSSPRSSTPTVLVPEGNLPDPRDRFHGRSDEVGRLSELLERERLVTLVGFGGAGKTRLALETGRACVGSWEGGVWCADLTESRSELDLCVTLSRTLGARTDETDPAAPVGDALRALGTVLVILDNLEQVRGPAATLIGRWLEGAPQASFLCTSRAPIGVRSERLFPLGPLEPEAAFALFLDRAAIPPPAEHHGEVRELVEALEGLPLAIELAAARTRVLPVPRIARRLDDRLRLLAGGGEQYPERHRSLLASIGWSWDLLQPWARSALAQLSVFEGGFSMEAAEGVVDLTAHGGVHWAIDVLHELVDASLLRVDPDAGRFSMQKVVHDFAAERLGADRIGAEERHGRYFSVLAEGLDHEQLVVEIDNLEAAVRRAVLRGDPVAGALALAAHRVHERQGPFRRSAELLGSVLGVGGLDPEIRLGVQRAAGRMQVLSGARERGRSNVEAAVAAAREAGLVRAEAEALVTLGTVQTTLGEHEGALASYRRALTLLGSRDRSGLDGRVLQNIGNVLQSLGRPSEAREAFEAAVPLLQRAGLGRSLVMVRANLGALHLELGDPELARSTFTRGLDGCRALRERHLEGVIRGNLGQVFTVLGRPEEAQTQFEEALRLHRRVGNRRSEAYVLANLGELSRREGRLEEALERHESALELARAIGLRLLEGGVLREMARDWLQRGDPVAAGPLLEESVRLLREVGARYELARALCLRGELEGSAEALEEARALTLALGVGPQSELAADLSRAEGARTP